MNESLAIGPPKATPICGTPRISRRAALAAIVLPSLAAAGCSRFLSDVSDDGSVRRSPPTDTEPNGKEAPRPNTPLARTAGYLWKQQSTDGGWHSATYGLLRSGQALTPFVLDALLSVPADAVSRPPGGVARAVEFIRRHANDRGVVGMDDPEISEYPNYSTAYALRCLVQAGDHRDAALAARMRDYLISEQFRDANGFTAISPAFGGWGFGGHRPAGSTGHMDIAHTRRALDAIRSSGSVDSAVGERAQVFLRLLQRHPSDRRPQPTLEPSSATTGEPRPPSFDGGFYLSPIVLDANKGGIESATDTSPAHFRSYATATCDGLLALVAAGVRRDDDRIIAARRWLEKHPRLDRVEGIPTDGPIRWGDAIFFYHLAVRAEVYSAFDWPGDWRDQITALLAPRQRPDGSFANTANHLMKEDDPLVATTLSAIVLARTTAGATA